MKARITTLAMVIGLALSVPAMANDEHHPEKAQEAAQAAPAKPQPKPAAAKPAADTVKAMQDNVGKMQAQLRRIAAAKSDDERARLLAEHMQTMHENMMMARGMQGGMGGCQMMGGMMSGGPGQAGMMEERMRQIPEADRNVMLRSCR